jgi:hypothetical protein
MPRAGKSVNDLPSIFYVKKKPIREGRFDAKDGNEFIPR